MEKMTITKRFCLVSTAGSNLMSYSPSGCFKTISPPSNISLFSENGQNIRKYIYGLRLYNYSNLYHNDLRRNLQVHILT